MAAFTYRVSSTHRFPPSYNCGLRLLDVFSYKVNFFQTDMQPSYNCETVVESVEHLSRMREIVGSNPWAGQTNDLYNLYLSLPSQVLSIIRIEQRLVGLVSG